MSDLILNINFVETKKRGRIVIDTYEGAIPHLKSRQYSGPLRNVDINGISSVDNLSPVDLEFARRYLNSFHNIQISKHQYALSKRGSLELGALSQLKCLFYKQKKSPMFQVDSVVVTDDAEKNAIRLDGITLSGNGNEIVVSPMSGTDEYRYVAPTAKAYINLSDKEHELRLVFDYDEYVATYGNPTTDKQKGHQLRDYGFESQCASIIRSCGWRQTERGGWKYTGKSLPNDILSLIEQGITVLTPDEKEVVRGNYNDIRVSYEIDWFDISGEVVVEDQKIKIEELIDLSKKGLEWVELNGKILHVPDAIKTIDTYYGKNGKVALGKDQLAIAVSLAHELNNRPVLNLDKLVDPREVHLDIDPKLVEMLRPYQVVGVKWLTALKQNGFGGCLADDMGLGKTLQVIAYLSSSNHKESCSLIVVPKTLIANWQRELQRFAPNLSTKIYHGQKRHLANDDVFSVILTTYGTLLNDIALLRQRDFANLIVDEAQYAKNPSSKIHRALMQINAETRIILTGTPLENNLKEYWGLMSLVNPNLFENTKLNRKGITDKNDIERIREITSPFLLRRMKTDVLTDLPEKREQTIYCSMDESQRAFYEKMLSSIRHELSENGGRFKIKSNSTALKGLLYLQEICCHPNLLSAELNPDQCNESAKLDLLLELVEELYESGHKTVVFSRFTRMLQIIEKKLKRHHINSFYLDGSTRNRFEIIDKFEESKSGVFLISLKAGGTGINLVSADTVILFDPWWNPAAEKQAEDRIFRIGQTKDVMIYRLIVEDTVEEKVQNLQQEKKHLYEQILDGHEAPMSLSSEDIMRLLTS